MYFLKSFDRTVEHRFRNIFFAKLKKIKESFELNKDFYLYKNNVLKLPAYHLLL